MKSRLKWSAFLVHPFLSVMIDSTSQQLCYRVFTFLFYFVGLVKCEKCPLFELVDVFPVVQNAS